VTTFFFPFSPLLFLGEGIKEKTPLANFFPLSFRKGPHWPLGGFLFFLLAKSEGIHRGGLPPPFLSRSRLLLSISGGLLLFSLPILSIEKNGPLPPPFSLFFRTPFFLVLRRSFLFFFSSRLAGAEDGFWARFPPPSLRTQPFLSEGSEMTFLSPPPPSPRMHEVIVVFGITGDLSPFFFSLFSLLLLGLSLLLALMNGLPYSFFPPLDKWKRGEEIGGGTRAFSPPPPFSGADFLFQPQSAVFPFPSLPPAEKWFYLPPFFPLPSTAGLPPHAFRFVLPPPFPLRKERWRKEKHVSFFPCPIPFFSIVARGDPILFSFFFFSLKPQLHRKRADSRWLRTFRFFFFSFPPAALLPFFRSKTNLLSFLFSFSP